jgi:hypothetical protein
MRLHLVQKSNQGTEEDWEATIQGSNCNHRVTGRTRLQALWRLVHANRSELTITEIKVTCLVS